MQVLTGSGGQVLYFDIQEARPDPKNSAWSYVTDEKSGKRKFFAVLHQGPVDSPHAAVRAAIVAEYRKEKE
jgi:hypothetical protein